MVEALQEVPTPIEAPLDWIETHTPPDVADGR